MVIQHSLSKLFSRYLSLWRGGMADNSDILINAVAELTRTRNKRALEKLVLPTFSQFFQCDGLCLLRVNQRRAEVVIVGEQKNTQNFQNFLNQYINSSNSLRPNLVSVDDDIDMAISTGVYLYDPKKQVAYFPSVISEYLVDVICVFGIKGFSSDVPATSVAKVATIYGDIISVLEESERDNLTGLLNRKTFDTHLEALLKQDNDYAFKQNETEKRVSKNTLKSEQLSHWIGVLDIDHFKSINDRFGHIYGDEVLLLFSDLMRTVFRNNDLIFRFGGEEFVVFLLNIDQSNAKQAFERFRLELENYAFPQVGKVTVSIGMTNMDDRTHTATLLDQADKALYFAKEHGRNQVCNYIELVNAGHFTEAEVEGEIDLF